MNTNDYFQISAAVEISKALLSYLRLDHDNSFDKIVLKPTKPASETNVEPEFERLIGNLQHVSCNKKIWLRERLLLIQKFDFKVHFYDNILDSAVNRVNDIFEQAKTAAKIRDTN